MTMDETQATSATETVPALTSSLLAARDGLLADPGATTVTEGLDAARILLADHARELGDLINAKIDADRERTQARPGSSTARDYARRGGMATARRMLDQYAENLEAALDGDESPTPDTLPAWLYQRFGGRGPEHAEAWDDLHDDDRSYWAHEAAAVRRAVARGGFKAGA